MATGDQIKLLIQSHYLGNEEHFNSIVLQLAAHEAKNGHSELAREIKNIVDVERKRKNKILKLGNYNESIEFKETNQKLTDMVIDKNLKSRLQRIIKEFKKQDQLKKYNLQNRRKILLAGPPGTGKTMTASILATELGLPLGLIIMDKIVTKYLGETSTKLRQIFETISNLQSVYLFDEFDAIGGERNKENDVGEMRRILNTFLQLIEQDQSNSLIIATTNNINLLDRALFRRFDDIIIYKNPDQLQIEKLISNKLAMFIDKLDLSIVSKMALGLSHSEITAACNDAIKESIINETSITENLIIKMIKERKEFFNRE